MRTNYNGSDQNNFVVDDWFNVGNESISKTNNIVANKNINPYPKAPEVRGVDFSNEINTKSNGYDLHDDLVNTFYEYDRVLHKNTGSVSEFIPDEENDMDMVSPYENSTPYIENIVDIGSEEQTAVKGNIAEPKPKKGSSILIAILCSLLVVSVGVGVVSTLDKDSITDTDTDGMVSTVITDDFVNSISAEIDALYTDSLKSDLRFNVTIDNVNNIRTKASILENDIQYSYIFDELKTIEMYITSKGILDSYMKTDFNLEKDGVISTCESIQLELTVYTVDGLKVSLSDKLSKFIAMREEYTVLKNELMNIEDILSFDPDMYFTRIDNISHTVNREYLMALLDKLEVDKKVAELEKAYKEAKDKDKSEAEDALSSAKEEQKDKLAEFNQADDALEEDTASVSSIVSSSAVDSRVESIKPSVTSEIESSDVYESYPLVSEEVSSDIDSKIESNKSSDTEDLSVVREDISPDTEKEM